MTHMNPHAHETHLRSDFRHPASPDLISQCKKLLGAPQVRELTLRMYVRLAGRGETLRREVIKQVISELMRAPH